MQRLQQAQLDPEAGQGSGGSASARMLGASVGRLTSSEEGQSAHARKQTEPGEGRRKDSEYFLHGSFGCFLSSPGVNP